MKQAGDDHMSLGGEGGRALMTYSWTLLAPCGRWEYNKQMQTGKGEGWGGRWGEERGTEERRGILRTAVVMGHRWRDGNILNGTNAEGLRAFSKRQRWNSSHYEMEHVQILVCVCVYLMRCVFECDSYTDYVAAVTHVWNR